MDGAVSVRITAAKMAGLVLEMCVMGFLRLAGLKNTMGGVGVNWELRMGFTISLVMRNIQ